MKTVRSYVPTLNHFNMPLSEMKHEIDRLIKRHGDDANISCDVRHGKVFVVITGREVKLPKLPRAASFPHFHLPARSNTTPIVSDSAKKIYEEHMFDLKVKLVALIVKHWILDDSTFVNMDDGDIWHGTFHNLASNERIAIYLNKRIIINSKYRLNLSWEFGSGKKNELSNGDITRMVQNLSKLD